MKKTISVIFFVISLFLFTYLLIVSIGFVTTLIHYPVLETNGDILGAMITIFAYAGTFLIISVLGLPFAIVSAKSFTNKIIRICSNVEIVFFSIGLMFSIFQFLIK